MASKQPSETTAAEAAYAKAAEAVTAPALAPVAEAAKVEAKAEAAPEAIKPAAKKAEKKPVARKAAKPARPVKAAAKPVANKKTTSVAAPVTVKARKTISKDKTMTAKKTNTNTDFAQGFQTVVADAQAKAKEAFDKGSAQFSEAGQFAKGNVEALVESGKILAAGLQQIASGATAEAKTAFETMTADVKELSTAKTPADFLRLHSDIMRRNFDAMVAYGSKNSETMMKLASDSLAPISTRVNLAVEKVRKAA